MHANPWLPYKRGHFPARLRLVCLPYAGGGATAYRSWIDALPGVEVLPVQPPGREGRFREPAFDRLPALVAALADAITPIPEPFALFGHSLGALTAFELAREFRRRGAPMPTMLVVSGRAAPHLPPRFPPLHTLPDAQFIAALKQFDGTPDAVADNADLMHAYLPLLRADFAAHETYGYVEEPRLALPIFAIGASDDRRVTADELGEWCRHGFWWWPPTVFAGGHFFLHERLPLMTWLRESALPLADGVATRHTRLRGDEPPSDDEWATLDELERARADKFRKSEDRARFVRGRCYLRWLLGEMNDVAPQDITFTIGYGGKPALNRSQWLEPDKPMCFNVSHSNDLYIVATASREVGVDIEYIRDDIEWRELAARYFTPAEVADLAALPPDDQRLSFYRVWTRKEAYLKALGLGLTVPLDGFRVSVGEPARLLSTDHDPSQLGRWSLESLDVPPGYVGALCVEDASMKRR